MAEETTRNHRRADAPTRSGNRRLVAAGAFVTLLGGAGTTAGYHKFFPDAAASPAIVERLDRTVLELAEMQRRMREAELLTARVDTKIGTIAESQVRIEVRLDRALEELRRGSRR